MISMPVEEESAVARYTPARGKMPVRARVGARVVTMVAGQETPVRVKAAALPTVEQLIKFSNYAGEW
jgi:hypothetical protein